MAGPEDVLFIGDSATSADIYYATRFFVTVTVMYLEIRGRKIILLGDLEFGRARAEARVDEIVSTTPYEDRLRAAGEPTRITSVLDLFLKERGVRKLTIATSFPAGHAEKLRERGYVLKVREDPFYPQRAVKGAEEIRAIEESQRHNEAAMELAVGMLRQAEIRGGVLHHRGDVLTAERVRLEIQRFLLERQCTATNTIVAGGDQGADPHTRGSGPLAAHETIIIDIFPQSQASRYWGDMTRTVVRGKASPAVQKLYADVLAAQELAFSRIKDGAEASQIHEDVVALFKQRGNENGEVGGRKTGFIHSTGHGLGLEIHEWPRLGKAEAKLMAGQIVTVEPGLYYPGIGAVRLEDVVEVTRDGCRNLNRFPKELEI